MPQLRLRRSLRTALLQGEALSDADFDAIYPEWARALSDPHWTPLAVARRAARLLLRRAGDRILDVGSGVGKFCVVGALTTPAQIVGVERRARLVRISRSIARGLGAKRATFLHGDLRDLDFSGFDGLYLFNPFYENISRSLPPIGDEWGRSSVEFLRHVVATYRKLCAAPLGLRVVTYHGYGGPIPPGYGLLRHEPAGTDFLDLWEKRSHHPGRVQDLLEHMGRLGIEVEVDPQDGAPGPGEVDAADDPSSASRRGPIRLKLMTRCPK